MPAKMQKSKEDILNRAVKQLERNTELSDLSPGSVARALLEVISEEMADVYAALDFNYAQGLLSKARGNGLDCLGGLLGIERTRGANYTIDKASCSFYFYLNTSPVHTAGSPNTTVSGIGLGSLSIPSGTLVSTSGDYVGRRLAYTTTDEINMGANDSMSYCGLRPSTTDMLLNTGKGTLTTHSYSTVPQLYCYNPKAVNAILNYEDDDTYRSRIRYELRRLASANRWALYMAALSVDGVKDASIKELARGLGSVEVVISPYRVSSNRALILQQVRVAVEAVRPAGISVTVKYPEFLAVGLNARLTLQGSTRVNVGERLRNQAYDLVTNYINSLTAGETLVFNRLISSVISLSGEISDFQINSFSVGGSVVPRRNYTPEEDEQLYAGTVNIL